VPGVPFMLVGFIGHAQAFGRESLRQLLRDDVGGAHRFRPRAGFLIVCPEKVERASFCFVKLAGASLASA